MGYFAYNIIGEKEVEFTRPDLVSSYDPETGYDYYVTHVINVPASVTHNGTTYAVTSIAGDPNKNSQTLIDTATCFAHVAEVYLNKRIFTRIHPLYRVLNAAKYATISIFP